MEESKARHVDCKGDLTFDLNFVSKGKSTDIGVSVQSANITIDNNFGIEGLSDLFYYPYYQVAEWKANLKASNVSMRTKTGNLTISYDFPNPDFDIYSKDGNIYWDASKTDLTDIGIKAGKYLFEDAYSFLKDQQDLTALIDALEMPDLNMESMNERAYEDPVLGNAMSMSKYDRDHYRVDIALSPAVIAAMAETFGKDVDRASVEATFTNDIRILDNTVFSVIFDATNGELTGILLDGGIAPQFDELQISEDLVLKGVTLRVNKGSAFWSSRPDFSLDFDTSVYEPFSWNATTLFE